MLKSRSPLSWSPARSGAKPSICLLPEHIKSREKPACVEWSPILPSLPLLPLQRPGTRVAVLQPPSRAKVRSDWSENGVAPSVRSPAPGHAFDWAVGYGWRGAPFGRQGARWSRPRPGPPRARSRPCSAAPASGRAWLLLWADCTLRLVGAWGQCEASPEPGSELGEMNGAVIG